MQVFQIKLKYHCSKPVKLQKFLTQWYKIRKCSMLIKQLKLRKIFEISLSESRFYKKWQTLAIIREISDSNLETRRYALKSGVLIPDYLGELTALHNRILNCKKLLLTNQKLAIETGRYLPCKTLERIMRPDSKAFIGLCQTFKFQTLQGLDNLISSINQ